MSNKGGGTNVYISFRAIFTLVNGEGEPDNVCASVPQEDQAKEVLAIK